MMAACEIGSHTPMDLREKEVRLLLLLFLPSQVSVGPGVRLRYRLSLLLLVLSLGRGREREDNHDHATNTVTSATATIVNMSVMMKSALQIFLFACDEKPLRGATMQFYQCDNVMHSNMEHFAFEHTITLVDTCCLDDERMHDHGPCRVDWFASLIYLIRLVYSLF